MSKQHGTDGRGNHNSEVSIAKSSKEKFAKMLLANEEIEQKEEQRRKKDYGKVATVSELMKSHKNKK